jgi:tetrahydromethanopterin S-methyltransferase subunit B
MGTSSGKSKIGTFFFGFFVGIFVSIILAALIARHIVRNPQTVWTKAQEMGMDKVVESVVENSIGKTVTSVPQEVIAVKQQDINQTVANLTQAYAENKLTPMDMQLITGKVFGIMTDQKISPQEIDELLRFLNELTR